MKQAMTRRRFLAATGAAAITLPHHMWGATENKQRFLIRADQELGRVSPLLHGQFAEHLGSCVYGGFWVGVDSHIPNLHGLCKRAIEYLQALSVPVLRWPGGCFADDYHWRDGIGPGKQRPKSVNLNWRNYVEDNSFGTHESIGLGRQIAAEPYLAGNVGQAHQQSCAIGLSTAIILRVASRPTSSPTMVRNIPFA